MSGALVAGLSTALAVALTYVSLSVRDRELVRVHARGPGFRRRAAGPRSAVASSVPLACLACAAAALGFVGAGPVGAIAGAVASFVLPSTLRRRRRAAQLDALGDGLADAVSAIAAALRAGRSMAGALDQAASTVGPPLGPRLSTLVARVTLGMPVESAVLELTASVPGPDGRLVASVLAMHHRSGGDAPAVLDRVAGTLRERRAAAREIRSLTAQARLSGAILGFLPIGFFLFLSLTARSDVERALHSRTGLTAVLVGLSMQATAFLWIRRLLRVEA